MKTCRPRPPSTGKAPAQRHPAEPDPAAGVGERAAGWRPGLQYLAGAARLAGRAREAAALVAQVFTNALARRRNELSLRESEARLAAGGDLAGLAFYEVDFEAGVIFIDDRFRDVCGVPPEREAGLQALEFWMEHLHSDDRQRVLDLRRQLHDGTLEQLNIDYRFRHPAR